MLSLIILIIVTLLAAGVAMKSWKGFEVTVDYEKDAYGNKRPIQEFRTFKKVSVGIAVLTAFIWLACSVVQVPSNTWNVRTNFGKPSDSTVGSGLHLVAPWSSGEEFSSANQWIKFVGDGNGGEEGSDEPKIKVRLARQATADVEGIAYYAQPSAHIKELFMTWKKELRIRNNYVLPELQQALNEAAGTYDPLKNLEQEKDALATLSATATEALQRRIGDKLGNIKIQLTNIDYDDNTEKQITDLQAALARTRVATQDRLTAEQVAAANKTISDSLKGDATTAYYRCVEMVMKTLQEIKPQQLDISAVCAMAVGVLK